MNELIRSYERLDDLERSGLKIIQNANKFCFGMDAVLLTGFVKIRNGEKTLDLGTGTGIIPILLSAKTKGLHFTGLEIQEDMADMASRSVKYNKLEEKIQIINGDIKEYKSLFSSSSFDVVTSNPPYMNDLHGIKNTESSLAIARHEISCSLEDVIKAAAYVLKASGKFFMVHRPHRLIPKRMCFVHPFLDKDANMVMIEALKGGGSFLKLEPPIVVYESQGVYTKQIYDIYGY